MYYSKSVYSLIFTVIFLALVTGCGGGGVSTVNPAPTPSVTPPPTQISTGTLIIKTAQNNGYATCDLFSTSSVSEPYAQIQLDSIGNGIFNNIPLNITLYVRLYLNYEMFQNDPANPLAGKTITFNIDGQEETITAGTVDPTPTVQFTPAPTNTPQNTSPTQTATVPPSPTPTNTPMPPSITSVTDSFVTIGNTITVKGNNFGNTHGTIKINNTQANILTWSSTEITCTVPTGSFVGYGIPVSFILETSDENATSFDNFFVWSGQGIVLNLSGPSGYLPKDLAFVNNGSSFILLNYTDKKAVRYNFPSFDPSGHTGSYTQDGGYITHREVPGDMVYISAASQIIAFDTVFYSSFIFGSGNVGISWNSATNQVFCCYDGYNLLQSFIIKYSAIGVVENAFFVTPGVRDIECDGYGNTYISNGTNGTIEKYDIDGNLLTSWERLAPGYLSSRKINQDILLFSSGDKSGPGENIIIYRNDERIGEIYFGEGVTLSGLDVHNGNILGVEEGTPGLYLMKY